MLKILSQTILLFLLSGGLCYAQQEIPLYPGPIPNSKEVPDEEERSANDEVDGVVRKVSRPTLSIFLPLQSNGSAVIICPGGGYHALLTKREGSDLAKAYNKMGVAAFVLKYRLPSDETMVDKSIGPLQDAQQAIKVIRERSLEWKVNPAKIGIMGFSAGGHLATMAGTQFGTPVVENLEATSLRPDFMILIYPVISFTDSIGHIGSRNFLLGNSPTVEQIKLYSNEFQVKKDTPPAFITHGGDDTVVPIANSLQFYQALLRKNIPAEVHIYAKGEHGYLQTPSFEEWFGRVENWMRSMELIR
jgi:acetyl esterase/lipase